MDITEMNGETAAQIVRAMPPGLVDNVTNMNTRGDDGWEAVCVGLRDAVAEAFESDRFAGEDRSDVTHEIADGEVPVMNRDRVAEFAIIGAAWSHETEQDITGLDTMAILGVVLYDVYREGAEAILAHVEEVYPDPDDDEIDD